MGASLENRNMIWNQTTRQQVRPETLRESFLLENAIFFLINNWTLCNHISTLKQDWQLCSVDVLKSLVLSCCPNTNTAIIRGFIMQELISWPRMKNLSLINLLLIWNYNPSLIWYFFNKACFQINNLKKLSFWNMRNNILSNLQLDWHL